MIIGDKLRDLREHRSLSQADIESRTGLLCCDISRVENGHTVPSIETLEKLARVWTCPSTNSSTLEKDRQPQGCRLVGPRMASSGEVLARMLRCSTNSEELLDGTSPKLKVLLLMAQKMAAVRSNRFPAM